MEVAPKAKSVNGLQLSQAFYEQIVWPLLSNEGYSGLVHSAGLLDSGSEVFGFDDVRSRDHHWGPRVTVFLKDDDHARHAPHLARVLGNRLPYEFMGYPTNFSEPDGDGVQLLQAIDKGLINHRVQLLTVSSFFRKWLNDCDPTRQEVSLDQWRTFPQQALFAIRNGRMFHDDLAVESVRKRLRFFPKQLWFEKLIREWSVVEQEEAFVGRTGEVNDEIGSRLIAARILNSLMKITFLVEKEYYPYSKWFGTAFTKLRTAKRLEPCIKGVLDSTDWREREQNLCTCYTMVMELQNSVSEMPRIEPEVSNFHSRPFKVPHARRIVQALKQEI